MRNATLTALAAVLAFAAPAAAQCTGTVGTDFTRVTVRDINTIPQSQIDQLNAAGASLTTAQIETLVQSPLAGERVEFSAVILTNPLLSGLASANNGIPGRIHVFMRDTAADTEGPAGQGIQIVDNRGDGAIQNYFIGDEVTVCGVVTYFGSTLQLAPESISSNSNPRASTDPILDPVVIATDDIHDSFNVNGDNRSQIDWDVYGDFLNQYVRFEGIELIQGIAGTNGRPNMLFSTSGDDTTIRSYDTSVCFRNDRDASYFPANQEPTCNQTDFVPPASGIVNVQGFLTIAGVFDAFGTTAVPAGGAFSISPFEDDDLVIAVAPPIVTVDDRLPSPGSFTVRANVVPGTSGNTVSSVSVNYSTSGGASGTVMLSKTTGDTYEGTIPNLVEGQFVTYSVVGTDNQGASTPPRSITRRVINGAVSSIADIQTTPDGGAGASSLITTDPIAFDLDAVVQTAIVAGGRFQATIQDDPTLGPFSGVLLDFGTTDDPGLSVGDRINISQARVSEFRDVTQLVDVTFTKTGSGDPYAPVTVSTVLFSGTAGAESGEQFESMLLRFEGGTITNTNPDEGAGNFGEFAFSTDGTAANQLRVDDASSDVPGDFNSTLTVGQSVVSIEGYLSFSFDNLKLIPVSANAIVLGGTAVGTGPGDSAVGITGSFPNPTTGTTRVRFELAAPGEVSLSVFDAMGRQVATVVEGSFSAASHDATVDLSGLATGVYVLRLQAGGDVATSRISIIR